MSWKEQGTSIIDRNNVSVAGLQTKHALFLAQAVALHKESRLLQAMSGGKSPRVDESRLSNLRLP